MWCRRHFNLGWGRVKSTLWHFMRLQTQFMNYLDIEVLPPYMPNQKVSRASLGSNLCGLLVSRQGKAAWLAQVV